MKTPIKNSNEKAERMRWLAKLLEAGGSIRINTYIDKDLLFRERVPSSDAAIAMEYLYLALKKRSKV